MKTVLYLTYDGLSDPLGQSQVIKYLLPLSKNYNIIIQSFEKKINTNQIRKLENILKNNKIKWYKLRYHSKPKIISSFYDIIMCLILSFFLLLRFKINIVHSRSYLPTFVAMILKYIFKFKLIFDMRGFWADERVDGNIWSKKSIIYKITKRIEILMLKNSDKIVTLTNLSRLILIKKFKVISKKITCIPTCVDLNQFNYKKYQKDKKISNYIVGYHGSIGTWYEFDKVMIFYKELKKIIINAKLSIVSNTDKKIIYSILTRHNINAKNVLINGCEHSEIHKYIRNFDVSVFFIKKCYSKIASCPTKFAESLSMGKPVITGSNIGDVDNIYHKNNNSFGFLIKEFNRKQINDSILHLLKINSNINTKKYCYDVAENNFSLHIGLKKYEKIYKSL